MPRYQGFFSGLCYAYNNYGHKAIDCRAHTRYRNGWGRNKYENSKYQAEENHIKRSQLAPNRNYNRFGALEYDIECYRCHNFGHIARNCRSRLIGPQDLFEENKQPSKYRTNWKGDCVCVLGKKNTFGPSGETRIVEELAKDNWMCLACMDKT